MLPFSYGVPLPEALPVVLYHSLPSIPFCSFKVLVQCAVGVIELCIDFARRKL